MNEMPHEQEKPPFNPNDHLMDFQGKPYLPVQWRLVWFREHFPHGMIETQTVHLDLEKGIAIFRATVADGNGGMGSGHGSESLRDFKDYIEKAETKAIGRALASLGYGTQFAPDLDEGDRIVDAPLMSDEGKKSPSTTPATRLLDKALAIPGVKRGLPPPTPVPSTNTNGKGGKPEANANGTVPPLPSAPTSVVPNQKNGATPSASAPPPPTPSVEEMRGAIKDYELSVSSPIFVHFILVHVAQPRNRSEWNIEQIYKELLVWQAGGEKKWREGQVTPDLVEKLKTIMEAFPKASVAAFRTRLPFLNQQEGRTFSDCTTEEVLSVIEMMREVSYLHDLGAVYDVFVDPARKARIAFHHLKTDYNVDHPLDLMARGGQEEESRGGSDPLAPGRRLFTYQKFLEGAYARKPDSFSADLCKRYANRLPALSVVEQVAAA